MLQICVRRRARRNDRARCFVGFLGTEHNVRYVPAFGTAGAAVMLIVIAA